MKTKDKENLSTQSIILKDPTQGSISMAQVQKATT